MSKKSNKYYTYCYYDPRTYPPTPFYVGKGSGKRLNAHINEAKNSNKNHPKTQKIKAIWKCGLEPIIEIIDDNLTELEALELEALLGEEIGSNFINEYKDGPLCNMVLCGEIGGSCAGELNGMFGKSHSNKWKKELGEINKKCVNIIDINNGKSKRVSKEEFYNNENYISNSKNRTWKLKQPRSKETLKLMKEVSIKNAKENPRKWMNKNDDSKMIKLDEIENYLQNGWKLGRKSKI